MKEDNLYITFSQILHFKDINFMKINYLLNCLDVTQGQKNGAHSES